MIHIESALGPAPVAAELIERAAQEVLAHESAEGDLTVVLTGDQQLQELNRQYLGIDATTDVLSFSASEVDPDTRRPYIGDVLISVPRAKAQAEAAGHPLEAEVQLLVVHGSLHLLGYDHDEEEERKRMWSVQREVLERIGLAGITISEA